MDLHLLNFSEWILKHFNVRIPECYNSIFFTFKCSVSKDIYVVDTSQTWDYFYTNIINNMSQNAEESKYNLVLTFQQLFSKNGIWEKLYYMLGKNFFLFLILDCKIYFKWGQKTHILLPYSGKYKTPEKPFSYNDKYEPSLPVYDVGFEKNLDIKIHRILYSTSQKVMKCLFPKKSPNLLKSDILSQDVGLEISKVNAFGVKQMKSLHALMKQNPTSTDCRLILDDVILAEENRVPVHKVILFLTKTIEAFVPYQLLFEKKILRRFLWNMQKFLRFTLKQKVTLGFVMNGIVEKQDPLQRNTIAKILMWLINKILIKMIRSFFYVTVADKGNSFIFYKQQFRVDFQRITLCKMITENRLLEVNGTIDLNTLKEIKFLPKLNGSGYRPLITKSKCDKLENYKSVLCNIFLKQLVASKRKNVPNPSSELHSAWLNFIKNRNKTLPYYYVKTDIKDAYGSVIHNKLKSLLQDWFHGVENDLTLLSFEFRGKWGKYETLQQFVNFPPSTGEKILTYKVGKDKVVSFNELKTHIFKYIDNIYVTFENKNYQVIKGLPQGGKLSAALCELYYTSFDEKYLSYLCNFDQGEMLLRAVDDYIFISHNQEKIHRFLNMMSSGILEYGVEIQNEKTITNLDDFIGTEFYSDSNVPFFGYKLDVNSGFITSDLDNYNNIDIQSTMTFNYLDKRILLQKMKSAITLKLHPLLFNREYQSTRTILLNIHFASCVMALKYIATVKFLKLSNIILDDKYLIFCINKATHSVASLVSRKSSKSIDYAVGKKICVKSFILILGRKKFNSEIIKQLEMKASRLKVNSRRLVKIIKTVVKILPSSLSHN